MDDRKNLPDREALIRRICATPQNQFAEFTEKKLLYHTLHVGDPFRPWTVAHLQALAEPIAAAQYELPMREIGGHLPTWDALNDIKTYRHEMNIHLHMDGARLWEAACGFDKGLQKVTAGFDSV